MPGRKKAVSDEELTDIVREREEYVISTADVAEQVPITHHSTRERLARLGWATLNRFFGGWIVTFLFVFVSLLLIGVGFSVLFILATRSALLFLTTALLGRLLVALFGFVLLIPGMILGVGLIFVGQEIAVRDKNLSAAFTGSWRITRQNRLALFVITIIPLVLQIIISYLVFTVLPGIFAQAIVSGETAILHIIVVAIMARAYIQAIDGELSPRFLKRSE